MKTIDWPEYALLPAAKGAGRDGTPRINQSGEKP